MNWSFLIDLLIRVLVLTTGFFLGYRLGEYIQSRKHRTIDEQEKKDEGKKEEEK